MKTGDNFKSKVELIQDSELKDLALASQNLNPMLTYIKFILTDDKPNANNMVVPKSEFANLIKTGLYMPIKMAFREDEKDHDNSFPVGVITHLREDGDKIRGIAALWNRERPQDVEYIKERYAEGKPLDLSWEIGHEDSFTREDGIQELIGCVLRATTLVGVPAYQGRTIITDVESANNNSDEEDTDMKEQVEKLTEEKKALEVTVAELTTELESLKQFKSDVEAEAKRQETLAAIRDSFEKAGIKRKEDFFKTNQALLLTLAGTKDALAFFINQLTENNESPDEEEEKEEETKEESKEESEEETPEDEEEDEEEAPEEKEASAKKKIPNLKNSGGKKTYSPKDLGKALRENKMKRKEN